MEDINNELLKRVEAAVYESNIHSYAESLNAKIVIRLVAEVTEHRHNQLVIVPFSFNDAVIENNVLLMSDEILVSVNAMEEIAVVHKMTTEDVISSSMQVLADILKTRIMVPTLAVFKE